MYKIVLSAPIMAFAQVNDGVRIIKHLEEYPHTNPSVLVTSDIITTCRSITSDGNLYIDKAKLVDGGSEYIDNKKFCHNTTDIESVHHSYTSQDTIRYHF